LLIFLLLPVMRQVRDPVSFSLSHRGFIECFEADLVNCYATWAIGVQYTRRRLRAACLGTESSPSDVEHLLHVARRDRVYASWPVPNLFPLLCGLGDKGAYLILILPGCCTKYAACRCIQAWAGAFPKSVLARMHSPICTIQQHHAFTRHQPAHNIV
jgi:hypothetical protein